jgi:hypothetical protein
MFTLVQDYHYSLSDIENIFPFERDIYIGMIKEKIESQKEQ